VERESEERIEKYRDLDLSEASLQCLRN